MLPKLQQSSIANSLRRDNLATQMQCIHTFIQVRTNSKASYSSKTTNPINLGKITMHPKIHIVPSEISPNNTSPKIKSSSLIMNPSMRTHFQDHSRNITDHTEMEAEVPAHSKRNQNSKNLSPNQEPSRKETSLPHNSEGTMTEEISPSESTIKIHNLNSTGKFQSSLWTIITIFPFSLMEPEKSLTLTVHSQFLEPMISLTKVETKFSQSFHNSSSPSKVPIS